jgi:glycosyltransferase involved in cell wall biosynthesis
VTLTAVILTFNEALHLPRCLESLAGVADRVLVVDSFSTDETVGIARTHGAHVAQHAWVNYASQFNWALAQLDANTDWVLRIDADEYLTPELAADIRAKVPLASASLDGFYLDRRMAFQGRLIRHGGVFPVSVLRVFRRGRGACENRWMDEHIKVAGPTATLTGELIDDSRRSLTWWIDKHNSYASREAVDLLNLEFGFLPSDTIAQWRGGTQAGQKRWIKERIYARLPGGLRALLYFLYRYLIRLGFLDGTAGAAFHVLQGFWYRYLVDAKVREVKREMLNDECDAETAIKRVLGISVADGGAREQPADTPASVRSR